MDSEEFQIIITKPAQERYIETILPYLLTNFSISRARSIESKIDKTINKLRLKPLIGTRERYLSQFREEFRFLLFRETRNFEIKIIYFISSSTHTIFITDFFPMLMNPSKLKGKTNGKTKR